MGPRFRTGARGGVAANDRGGFLPDNITYMKVTAQLWSHLTLQIDLLPADFHTVVMSDIRSWHKTDKHTTLSVCYELWVQWVDATLSLIEGELRVIWIMWKGIDLTDKGKYS